MPSEPPEMLKGCEIVRLTGCRMGVRQDLSW